MGRPPRAAAGLHEGELRSGPEIAGAQEANPADGLAVLQGAGEAQPGPAGAPRGARQLTLSRLPRARGGPRLRLRLLRHRLARADCVQIHAAQPALLRLVGDHQQLLHPRAAPQVPGRRRYQGTPALSALPSRPARWADGLPAVPCWAFKCSDGRERWLDYHVHEHTGGWQGLGHTSWRSAARSSCAGRTPCPSCLPSRAVTKAARTEGAHVLHSHEAVCTERLRARWVLAQLAVPARSRQRGLRVQVLAGRWGTDSQGEPKSRQGSTRLVILHDVHVVRWADSVVLFMACVKVPCASSRLRQLTSARYMQGRAHAPAGPAHRRTLPSVVGADAVPRVLRRAQRGPLQQVLGLAQALPQLVHAPQHVRAGVPAWRTPVSPTAHSRPARCWPVEQSMLAAASANAPSGWRCALRAGQERGCGQRQLARLSPGEPWAPEMRRSGSSSVSAASASAWVSASAWRSLRPAEAAGSGVSAVVPGTKP